MLYEVITLEELAVDGDPGEVALLDIVEAVGEGHFAEAVVVAVGLAVGGDVDP